MKKIDIHTCFINEPNEDAFLWRYYSLDKFLHLIIQKKLFFSRIDNFGDLDEGILPITKPLKNTFKKFDNTKTFLADKNNKPIISIEDFNSLIDRNLDHFKKTNFVSSWFVSDLCESSLMWNQYSQPNGIALRINYYDFKNLITEIITNNEKKINDNNCRFFAGKVQYLNYTKKIEDIYSFIEYTGIDYNSKRTSPAFVKHSSYSGENEYRLLLETTNENLMELELDIYDINLLKSEVILHPKSFNTQKDTLTRIVSKFGLKEIKIIESELSIK